MDSRTKNYQSRKSILSMVERAFGRGEVPDETDAIVELDHGWFNAVYRVRLRSGRHTVLKIAPGPGVKVLSYERQLLRNEIAAMTVIEQQTELPVAGIEYADFSADLVDAPWFFMTFLQGENLGLLLDKNRLSAERAETFLGQLGIANRLLNEVTGSEFGPVAGPGWPSWRQAFERSICDLIEDAQFIGCDLDDLSDRVLLVLDSHGHALDAVTVPRLVAWDLWPGNVLVKGDQITGIVDHERALWGDPLMEAAFMNGEVPIYPRASAFALGYKRQTMSEEEILRRRLYSAHLLLVMIIEPHFRGPQDPQQSSWAREKLGTLLDSL